MLMIHLNDNMIINHWMKIGYIQIFGTSKWRSTLKIVEDLSSGKWGQLSNFDACFPDSEPKTKPGLGLNLPGWYSWVFHGMTVILAGLTIFDIIPEAIP